MSLRKTISHKTLKKRNPSSSRDRSTYEGGELEKNGGRIKTTWEEMRATQIEESYNTKSSFYHQNSIATTPSYNNWNQPNMMTSSTLTNQASDFPILKTCTICFCHYNHTEMYTLSCEHQFCKRCIQSHIELAISNLLEASSIRCPLYKCEVNVNENEIRQFVNDEYFERYLRFKEELSVLLDKATKYCPQPNCGNIVEIPNRLLLGRKIKCLKCKNYFCRECGFEWHEGKTCTEILTNEFGEWAEKTKTHKCPRCMARIEKNEGCQHMTCGLCKYEWCWVCGLSFENFVHSKEVGSTFCEMIGSAYDEEGKCRACYLLILTGIFMPLLVWIVGICSMGVYFIKWCKWIARSTHYGNLLKRKIDQIWQAHPQRKRLQLLKAVAKTYVKFTVGVVFILLCFGFGTLVSAIALIPCYLFFIMILIRVPYNWRSKNMI